ncbi:hypothetical protein PtrV1_11403 [Pyrenophora tritici-repentis]|nr:hypothetical protein PtrV1_11403 [Pyrenophora tritici-repentis]
MKFTTTAAIATAAAVVSALPQANTQSPKITDGAFTLMSTVRNNQLSGS